ncbi:MAG: hypothetical protein VB051_00445 [Candidatus Pelethousia sp.]|nr:hypothetical protein [Candidatus Pelethousia sp.]
MKGFYRGFASHLKWVDAPCRASYANRNSHGAGYLVASEYPQKEIDPAMPERPITITLLANAGLMVEYAGARIFIDGLFAWQGHAGPC